MRRGLFSTDRRRTARLYRAHLPVVQLMHRTQSDQSADRADDARRDYIVSKQKLGCALGGLATLLTGAERQPHQADPKVRHPVVHVEGSVA